MCLTGIRLVKAGKTTEEKVLFGIYLLAKSEIVQSRRSTTRPSHSTPSIFRLFDGRIVNGEG